MQNELPTVEPRASLRRAMEVIERSRVEIALVVDEEGRLVGTLTDGDVRRALLTGAGLNGLVENAMARRFTAVSPETSRAEVLDLMRARTLSQLPIVDAAGILKGLHLLREILGASPRPNWAVIMAGGRGERLRPLTDSLPKGMISVAGRPILERIVLHLVGFGIRKVFLSVGYMAEVIKTHFGTGVALGCQIEYLEETVPLGTGGALSLLPAKPECPVIVVNGDLVTQFDLGALLTRHESSGAVATLGAQEHRYTVPFGVLETNSEGEVRSLREKPDHVWLANAGVYVLDPALVERVPAGKATLLTEIIEECLERGERVVVHHLENGWIDVGRPTDLQRARGET